MIMMINTRFFGGGGGGGGGGWSISYNPDSSSMLTDSTAPSNITNNAGASGSQSAGGSTTLGVAAGSKGGPNAGLPSGFQYDGDQIVHVAAIPATPDTITITEIPGREDISVTRSELAKLIAALQVTGDTDITSLAATLRAEHPELANLITALQATGVTDTQGLITALHSLESRDIVTTPENVTPLTARTLSGIKDTLTDQPVGTILSVYGGTFVKSPDGSWVRSDGAVTSSSSLAWSLYRDSNSVLSAIMGGAYIGDFNPTLTTPAITTPVVVLPGSPPSTETVTIPGRPGVPAHDDTVRGTISFTGQSQDDGTRGDSDYHGGEGEEGGRNPWSESKPTDPGAKDTSAGSGATKGSTPEAKRPDTVVIIKPDNPVESPFKDYEPDKWVESSGDWLGIGVNPDSPQLQFNSGLQEASWDIPSQEQFKMFITKSADYFGGDLNYIRPLADNRFGVGHAQGSGYKTGTSKGMVF